MRKFWQIPLSGGVKQEWGGENKIFLALRVDISKTGCICAFDWHQGRWPSMTLNCHKYKFVGILRYVVFLGGLYTKAVARVPLVKNLYVSLAFLFFSAGDFQLCHPFHILSPGTVRTLTSLIYAILHKTHDLITEWQYLKWIELSINYRYRYRWLQAIIKQDKYLQIQNVMLLKLKIMSWYLSQTKIKTLILHHRVHHTHVSPQSSPIPLG